MTMLSLLWLVYLFMGCTRCAATNQNNGSVPTPVGAGASGSGRLICVGLDGLHLSFDTAQNAALREWTDFTIDIIIALLGFKMVFKLIFRISKMIIWCFHCTRRRNRTRRPDQQAAANPLIPSRAARAVQQDPYPGHSCPSCGHRIGDAVPTLTPASRSTGETPV